MGLYFGGRGECKEGTVLKLAFRLCSLPLSLRDSTWNMLAGFLIGKVSLCLEGAFIPFFFFSLETNYSTGPLVIQLNHAVVDAKVPLGL